MTKTLASFERQSRTRWSLFLCVGLSLSKTLNEDERRRKPDGERRAVRLRTNTKRLMRWRSTESFRWSKNPPR